MEEKKRRPRITKPDSDSPLNEREENSLPDSEQSSGKEPIERKPWQNREGGGEGGFKRPYDNDRPGGYQNREGGAGYKRPYDNDRPGGYQNREGGGGGGYRRPYDNDRPGGYQNREGGGGGGYRRPYDNDRPGGYQNREGGGGYRRPYDNDRPGGYQNREGGGEGGYKRPYDNDRPGGYQNREGGGGGGYRRPYDNDRPGGYQNREGGGRPFNRGGGGGFGKKPFRKKDDFYVERKPKPGLPSGEGMPLNKYLAHCGMSSRRKAVEYIEQGKVTVNGAVKMEPYYRIQAGDVVVCDGTQLQVQERMVYVLLNKPKNVITTSDDERGRITVLDIIDPHFPERIYPVGRLDRDTTGLILLTNDGDLSHKLTHPSYRIQKQYRVGLRSSLTEADFELIQRGVKLEDGVVEVNWIRFSEDHPDRDIVELEITSGRNRVIRRLFEALGYEIFKLDRFYFAGITKKDLARGAFRELTQREVLMLKHFTGHPSTTKKMSESGELEEMDTEAIEVVKGSDEILDNDMAS